VSKKNIRTFDPSRLITELEQVRVKGIIVHRSRHRSNADFTLNPPNHDAMGQSQTPVKVIRTLDIEPEPTMLI